MENKERTITLQNWKGGIKSRKEINERYGLGEPCRRKNSSSDKRLKKLFKGKRAPDL